MVAAALQPPSLQVSMQSWASVKSLMSKAVASVEAFGSGEPAANQRGGAAGGDDNDPLFGSEAGGGGRGGSAAAARGDDAVRPPIQPPTAIRLFFLSPSTLSLSLSLSCLFSSSALQDDSDLSFEDWLQKERAKAAAANAKDDAKDDGWGAWDDGASQMSASQRMPSKASSSSSSSSASKGRKPVARSVSRRRRRRRRRRWVGVIDRPTAGSFNRRRVL